MEAIQHILQDPKYHDILSILKGFRNGVVYGAKVRFPHALVMTILFKTGS
jgi:peroxisomal membrane protein 4